MNSEVLLHFVAVAAGIAMFRAVPFVVWACVSRKVLWQGRLFAAVAISAGTAIVASAGVDVSEIVLRAPLALSYFALLGVGAYYVRPLARLPSGRLILAALLLVAYVGAPARLIGGPAMMATVVVGWEMGIAAYALCRATCRQPDLRMGDALFFLLVDPSLVYEERAKPVVAPRRERLMRGMVRSSWGVAKLVAHDAAPMAVMAVTALPALQIAGPSPGRGSDGAVWLGASYLTAGLALYWAHAGLASVQIGYLAMAGYRVSERYQHPYLARSPADFWHRWNRWMGRWAYRHVYLPLALSLGRRVPRWLRRPSAALTAVTTFVVVGALHDALALAMHGTGPEAGFPYAMSVVFAFAGISFVAWYGLGSIVAPRMHRPSGRLSRALLAGAQRLAFWTLMLGFIWCAVPAVMWRQLPDFGF